VDKFEKFKLTKEAATEVKAPLITECHTSLECKIHDAVLIDKYNFFIFEVVKAHAAVAPKYPETIHYRGEGHFMVSGEAMSLRERFTPGML